jgi:hypothetical protein
VSDKPPPPIDPAAMRSALVSLRVAVDDLDFVTEDLLKPARRRFWGHLTHTEKHAEALGSIGHGDPSGNGGAGPTH